MLDRLLKSLGYHVCEEFTQWQEHHARYSRPTDFDRDGIIAVRQERIEYTRRWQERRCTICGKIQQHELGS